MIRHNINEGKINLLVSLDLSRAFDSIDHCNLVSKLRHKFKFSKTACRLIYSYLTGRSQFVDIKGSISETRRVYMGVPQGSVIGPLLFVLYLNDLMEVIESSYGCKPFIFADDIQLLLSNEKQYKDVLEAMTNFCLANISSWMIENKFSINLTKTKCIAFAGNFQLDFNIHINGVRLQFVDHLRCLGVWIDNRLDFGNHIDRLSARITYTLRRLYNSNIFLPVYIKRNIAFALLMSQIAYCLELISGTISINLVKLERVFNRIVRFVFNVRIREHITPYVIRLLGCTFRKFIDFRLLFFFYKIILSSIPPNLRNIFNFSRSTRNIQVIIPRISTSLFERSFLIRVARLWNSLPSSLRIFADSKNVFRRKLYLYMCETS